MKKKLLLLVLLLLVSGCGKEEEKPKEPVEDHPPYNEETTLTCNAKTGIANYEAKMIFTLINKKYDKHAYTFIKHYHTETDLNAAYAVIENDTNYSNVTKDGLMIKGEIQKEGNFEDMMRDELKAYMESTTEKYDTYTWSCY